MSSITLFSKEENQTRALSLLRIAINLGISIGPVVGGVLIASLGYKRLFICNGGTAIITFFIFLYFNKTMKIRKKPKSLSKKERKANYPINDKDYLWLLLVVFLMFTAFIQIIFLVPVFFKDIYQLSEIEVGIFFTVNGLLIVLFEMPIVHYFETKKLFTKPILAGTSLMIIGFLALMLPIHYHEMFWILPFVIYTIGISIGEILNLPFLGSLALSRTTKENSGSYMGLFSLVTSIAFTVAPFIGTRIVSKFGYTELWIVCIVMLLVSNILFSKMRKKFVLKEDYK
jgi:predicted MFS family arabinose efflux permease